MLQQRNLHLPEVLPTAQRRLQKATVLLPIVFFEAYLAITVLAFAFGPWPYPIIDGSRLYTFIFLAHLALALGYWRGAVRPLSAPALLSNPTRILFVSVMVNAILFLPTFAFRTGSWNLDLSSAIADLGAAYDRSNYVREANVPLIEYIRFFFGFPLSLLLPLLLFYWSDTNRTLRVAALVCVIGIAIMFVAMGTNKALADIAILSPWVLLARHFSSSRLQIKHGVAVLLTAAVLGIVFLNFFASTQESRETSAARAGYFPQVGIHADPSHPLLRNLPKEYQTGVLGLTMYTGQGYYALYLALEHPFVPGFGVGHSMFLTRQAARLPGFEWIADTPYPVRIEPDGWSAFGLFSSIYPWIASDVGFPGTIFVVFIIGYAMARSWREAILFKNPYAVAAFAQFCIMVYYFPANNQCLQSGETLAAFWGTVISWQVLGRARVTERQHARIRA